MKQQIMDVEVEHLDLKIGTLKADLTGTGFGEVTLDGKSVRCSRLDIYVEPGKPARVRLEVVVIES